VATPQRGSTGFRRSVLVVSAALALLIAPAATGSAFAQDPVPPTPDPAPSSQPAKPTTAADAQDQLTQVQREAEALTEQWHAAQDDLESKKSQVGTLQQAIGPARDAADKAKADEETYRKTVDELTLSTFESGNLDQFNALLASKSPQQFLDQMSALETIAADKKVALDGLIAVVDTATKAQHDADDAVRRAQSAVDDAAKAEQDLEGRKKDAEIRIDEAEKLLKQLSPAQVRDRNGPDVDAPALPGGTGVGVLALKAAATQLGKPYVWGATGPGSYDCSGLTSFAFKKAGVTLPRSSSAQATVGSSVSFDQMQPGDLVFYYHPVSHVGIYAGDGKMINAPQSGDVVRYQAVSTSAFSGARRL
jgi:peptidoglycan DL-endopeptidase CwlO